jgi:membrane protein DedA with SNARE-associated domain
MDYIAAQALAFIKHNPEWALFIIGLTAFGESFVFLSLLFPGTAILIAAGALVSEGILKPLPTISAGFIGAVLGDSVSFWLGVIGSIRRECADHFVVLGEAHLRRILKDYARYYNDIRTHRSLEKDVPVSRPVQRTGIMSPHAFLGGLHQHYVRI